MIGIVSSNLLPIMMLSSQFECGLGWSPFVVHFVLLGSPLSLKVSVGFLKRTEDGDVVGRRVDPFALVLLLIRLQLD